MSHNSVATISSSSPPSSCSFFSLDSDKLELESVKAIVATINEHLQQLLVNQKVWKSLKLKCTSNIKHRKQDYFEFSEYSVLSNLYWGIESIESATQANCQEERSSSLHNSEKMLQVPASLNEHGATAGIPNHFLVCCSYFYLSIVEKLQGDVWQAATHFFQAIMVSPMLVYTQFAPELCQHLCLTYKWGKGHAPHLKGKFNPASVIDSDKEDVNQMMKRMASRCKAHLMYYRIMSYKETPQMLSEGVSDGANIYDESSRNKKLRSIECSNLCNPGNKLRIYCNFGKVHPLDAHEMSMDDDRQESSAPNISSLQSRKKAVRDLILESHLEIDKSSSMKRIKDILVESQPETPIYLHSCECSSRYSLLEEPSEDSGILLDIRTTKNTQQAESSDQIRKQQTPDFVLDPESTVSPSLPSRNLRSVNDVWNITGPSSGSFCSLSSELEVSTLFGDSESQNLYDGDIEEETTQSRLQGPSAKNKVYASCGYRFNEVCKHSGETLHVEPVGILEKLISKICLPEEAGNYDKDSSVEIAAVYEMLKNKTGVKHSLLEDVILDQLITTTSTSKKQAAIRASISILSTIVSRNKLLIGDIKKRGLEFFVLADALKRNVHEAATLIYLLNPSPAELKALDILPSLVEMVCTSNSFKSSLLPLDLPPPVASLMIIEVLVTAFGNTTNTTYLATISSPRVISGLLGVPRNNQLEDFISLGAILVRCMKFDGQCKSYIAHVAPVAPYVYLLRSDQKHATSIALEYFHELLQMPRSSAISVLQKMQNEGDINNKCALLHLIQNSEPEYKLLAANLLLHLEILEETPGVVTYQDEAVHALLHYLSCTENSTAQALSAFILSNLGGTYSWTGKSYTTTWMVKKAGLTLLHHKNMIKNFDFSDQTQQDADMDKWCSKAAKQIINFGSSVFQALEKGLKSKSKRVSRDCLIAISWLGCEIVKSPDDLRYAACEILLNTIEQYVHPGLELDERVLACLCIYNYTSGKGMKRLVHFSEGVRESLRRLSNVTWMAEELLKVADYLEPNKWRISCVHTQVLEAGQKSGIAVTALTFYRGQLYSGCADGSIKVWDINEQTAILIEEIKAHKKAVTCFSFSQTDNLLLSGSADKSIKIWQITERNLECIEVISTKDSIQSIETDGKLIIAITKNHKLKVFDASRKTTRFLKKKRVKCARISHGKAFIGCMDSSMQELAITTSRQQEIKVPSKWWRMQRRPINAIAVYKDWLFTAGKTVEGSKIKEWRKSSKPCTLIAPEKGANVLAMEVVEDFIYLNCSTSASNLQIYLRGSQNKVGRLSAGGKITSLISANDMIICGTDMGLIKGWIPL